MSKHLVIVESPAKAKTISGFLGKDYIVEASYGHVRDLPKSGMSIDIEHNFKPEYEISPDKKKRITELKKLVKAGSEVWLATDEDREGEAISWHLCQALGLDAAKTKRIAFHEITKTAIQNALEHPRTVDQHLVDAQQARRVLDRLVGYELSPVLWRKVQGGLSAGRVQSVAVRLIVEREREIAAGERQYLMRQTDEIRQAAKANEAVLKEQLQEAKSFAESFQARAGRAESEAAFWRGKAEAAAEESSRWQRASEEAAGKIDGLQGRIRILEHELTERAPEESPTEKAAN
jgi:DNA topoisomerase-1